MKLLDVKNHLLELESFNSIQLLLHLLDGRLSPVDFEDNQAARSTEVLTDLVQPEPGLDVAGALTETF